MLNLTDPVLEFNKSIREVEAKKAREEKREEPAAIVSHSVTIEQISPSIINIIQNTTKQMRTLKDEMSSKKDTILAQAEEIQKKVNMLKNVKSVRINEDILKRHFMEALYFCHVLTESVQTFEAELTFWEQLVSAPSACTIDTLASLSQEPNAYLTEKLESLKRLVKRNTKNIPIAYSRFNHLFQDQLRELNVIELYVKNNNIKLDNPSTPEKAH